jgi:ribosome-associated protein
MSASESANLQTPRGLLVQADSVSWIATRSGGPGGQHANTSDTAVTVTIDVAATGLADVLIERITARAGASITAFSSQSRSQWRNRQLATATALERLDEAAKPPPPPRRPTRPSRGAKERRLDEKHRVSEIKQSRQRPGGHD